MWKDPRFIFTLHLWQPVFEALRNSTSPEECNKRLAHLKLAGRHRPVGRSTAFSFPSTANVMCKGSKRRKNHRREGYTMGPSSRLPLVLSVVRNRSLMRRSYLHRAFLTEADAGRPHPKFNGLTVDQHVDLKEAWRRWQLANWPGPKLELQLADIYLPKRHNVDNTRGKAARTASNGSSATNSTASTTPGEAGRADVAGKGITPGNIVERLRETGGKIGGIDACLIPGMPCGR